MIFNGGTVAITGGYVVTQASAPIEGGTVLVQNGVITDVGVHVVVPEGVPVVDASGKWVLPGLVDAHTHLGVFEEGEGWAGSDGNEVTDPNGARLDALDAVNPADIGFHDALAGGVTTCLIKPGSSNPIGGLAVAVKTWGRTVTDMAVKSPAGMKSSLGENPKRAYGDKGRLPSSRLGIAAVIRDAFSAAEDYAAARDEAGERGAAFKRDLNNEALAKVLSGELTLYQHAHRADDIATALRLAKEFGYRLVLVHATEARHLVDEIAGQGVQCIVGPLIHGRSKVELRGRDLSTAGTLARAGVTVALTTDHPFVPIDLLALQAVLAVRSGMDRQDALDAITVAPARMIGLEDRVGALRPGLDGDVVLWSGDPLDVYQQVERVFIGGRPVFERDGGRPVVADPRAV